jgi:hypothetical protein
MGKRIDLPQQPQGSAEEQMRAMYSYLYQMAQALNNNLEEIGGAELTDSERTAMQEVLSAGAEAQAGAATEAETLKSLIIKTASFIRTAIDQYNLKLTGSTEAEGKIGKYVRNTQMDVDVTPTGIQQSFSFQEIIQGLKTYEINAKNYIKSGLLRTVNGVPVYGVAIGKDIVTFAEDGTETYNDGNKVAELTAEELSFWQNSTKVASYKGTGITFAEDVTIQSGKKLIIDTENFKIDSNGNAVFSGRLSSPVGEIGGLTIANDGLSSDELLISSVLKAFIAGGVNLSERGLIIDYPDFNSYGKSRLAFGPWYSIGKSNIPQVSIQGPDDSGDQGLMFVFQTGKEAGNYSETTIDCRKSSNDDIKAIIKVEKSTMVGGQSQTYRGGGQLGVSTMYRWKSIYVDTINYLMMTQGSSRDIKHDIRDMPSMGERLDRLRPVTFVYDEDAEERTRYGLIYEEAAETMPEICTGSEEEKAINYIELIPMLLKEIQELRGRVNELERRLDNVQSH